MTNGGCRGMHFDAYSVCVVGGLVAVDNDNLLLQACFCRIYKRKVGNPVALGCLSNLCHDGQGIILVDYLANKERTTLVIVCVHERCCVGFGCVRGVQPHQQGNDTWVPMENGHCRYRLGNIPFCVFGFIVSNSPRVLRNMRITLGHEQDVAQLMCNIVAN
jgi:hypothetical protein